MAQKGRCLRGEQSLQSPARGLDQYPKSHVEAVKGLESENNGVPLGLLVELG